MSTRCNIIIKSEGHEDVILYHHHDGYPTGVGQILTNFILKNVSPKASTPESLAFRLAGIGNEYEYRMGGDSVNHEYPSEFEKVSAISGDIEYIYLITLDGDGVSVICYAVTFDFKSAWHNKKGWNTPFTLEDIQTHRDNHPVFSFTKLRDY